MKSYTIDELVQLYKNDKKDQTAIHMSNDQVDKLFSSLSSQQVDPKTLNESKEGSNSQLNVNLKESLSQEELRRMKRERNPLHQIWRDVCPHLDDSTTSSTIKDNIQSNSRKIRRTLNNEEEFQKELRDHKSVVYDAVVVDLLELNRHTTDKSKKYSALIDDYFRSKTGQSLFDLSNEDLTKLIDNDNFPKYYEYGYHNKETEKSFDLKIDKNFLNAFKEIIYDNLKQHNFNLNSKEICESPNKYEIVDVSRSQQLTKKKTRAL